MQHTAWIRAGLTLCLMITMALAGCGGGGGSTSEPAPTPTPTPVPTPTPTPAPDRALLYSTTVFAESSANDGSISSICTITLANDTFSGAIGAALGSVTNIPAGLTASLVKASANSATLSFSGKATAHANSNDISNLTVIFSNADFTLGNAATVINANKSNLVIDFADPAPVVIQSIKGFWTGTQGTSSTQAIILANGDSWVVFMEAGAATRFARLQTTVSANSFSSSGNQYKLLTGTTETATASGTFAEKAAITGSLLAASGTSSLNLAYDSRFESTARLADVVGSWRGSYNGGSNNVTMNVTATGVLTGSSTTGCSYNGSLQPRSADPALFDLRFTETCLATAAKYLEGIATINAAKTGISFAVTTPDKTQGALFSGTR